MTSDELAIYHDSLRTRTLKARRSLRRDRILLHLCEAAVILTTVAISLAFFL